MNIEPDKVDLTTADLAAANRNAFEQLFPGVLADGVLDAGRLGELLDVDVTLATDSRERYGLMWAGKHNAIRSLLAQSAGTLVPDIDNSINFDTAQNVFIEGDNLEVLKLLQKSYNDRVKLIYIDPPYNTGNDDFIYHDDFSDTLRAYFAYTGQVDAAGNRKSASASSLGRRHSRWLSMLYPRLFLARNLLRPDGILAVSIDDNEVANLRTMLDEIFGVENFLNTFVWVSNLKGRQIGGSGAAGTKEYIHVYARDIEKADVFRASASLLKGLMPSTYKGFDYELQYDDHGPYVLKNELHNTNSAFNEVTRKNLVYDIYYNPDTHEVKTEPVSETHIHAGYEKIPPKRNNNGVNKYHAFRWSRDKVAAETHNLEFVKTAKGYKVFTKVRDVDSTTVKDLITDISTNEGSRDLKSLDIDPAWFDYPKPARLIQLLVAFGTDRDSLILDFFAGSGTTGHAVALQNSVDGGRRKTISVNLPELTPEGSEAKKAGMDRVTDVTLRRLKAIANKVDGAEELGLRVFTLGVSNFKVEPTGSEALLLTESTLAEGPRDWSAIAAEVFLKEGVPLDRPWLRHNLGSAEAVVSDEVAVVLTDNVDDELVSAALDLTPRILVFLEDGFAAADAVKANAFTNAKNAGITLKTV